MIDKAPVCPDRIRKITGSFAFFEHRFLRDGFWEILTHHELLLYVFLILVGDRNGLSYYSYDKICVLVRICVEEYIQARNALIDKDLIAFDGQFFQVLSLPERPVMPISKPLKTDEEMAQKDPATIHKIIRKALG